MRAMDLLKYFREDSSKILGVYYDGEKIYLARLSDKIETAEIYFEVATDGTPAVEQLAAKVKLLCEKNSWRNLAVGLVLREGTAATFQTEFRNVPDAEIEGAVKVWALANVNDARYSSIRSGEEIWMEAVAAPIVEEYVSAFEKNAMKLYALTEFPQILADVERPPTPFTRAIFAADIVKNKKPPNILSQKISKWNVKKIALTAAAIFVVVLAGISAKLAYEYMDAATRTETAQERLLAKNDTVILKEEFDAATGEIKRIDEVIAGQEINTQNFNALVRLGKIADRKITPEKIRSNEGTLELEGTGESPDAVKHYLARLKSIVSPKVKLKRASEEDGQSNFAISADLGK